MSRSIDISYRSGVDSSDVAIDIRAPYYLLGTQQTSLRFWSLRIWKELGVRHLAELGHTDPVYFIGWEQLNELADEIRLFADNIQAIDFDADVMSSWLAHLTYCHNLLRLSAPADSIPIFSIG